LGRAAHGIAGLGLELAGVLACPRVGLRHQLEIASMPTVSCRIKNRSARKLTQL
jgi:hypothetical protein